MSNLVNFKTWQKLLVRESKKEFRGIEIFCMSLTLIKKCLLRSQSYRWCCDFYEKLNERREKFLH